ncbi:MAG TPA: SDR family NAD(P)-dependent oxidoreductase [Chitinophaga sp.]|uniref:SDR family NAD(P)-dependent oxidoreductase n=1 Tax=Chitinophaga sp. TaxID=1869181 RepID=UPI002F91DE9C
MGNSLSGKIALVVDGTGYVGKGIVQAFLEEDATVVVPASSMSDIAGLKAALQSVPQDKLVTFLTDIADYAKVKDYADMLYNQFKRIDLAVTYINASRNTRSFLQTDIEEWQTMGNSLTAYFAASRALFTLMQDPNSMYVTMSNADHLARKPHTSLHHLSSLFQMEIAGLFAQEKHKIRTRYHHVYIENVIAPLTVGQFIIKLYCGLAAEPGKIFQCCSAKTFHNEIIQAILKD